MNRIPNLGRTLGTATAAGAGTFTAAHAPAATVIGVAILLLLAVESPMGVVDGDWWHDVGQALLLDRWSHMLNR
jgi:hypothetical protein